MFFVVVMENMYSASSACLMSDSCVCVGVMYNMLDALVHKRNGGFFTVKHLSLTEAAASFLA